MARREGTKQIIQRHQSKSVRKFKDRQAVYVYLEQEVFKLEDFKRNVKETADSLDISYIVAYDVVTNYLTDVLYDIDKNVKYSKKKKKINMYSYFSLIIGFMVNLNDRKMYIKY